LDTFDPMKQSIVLISLFSLLFLTSNSNGQGTKITYQSFQNGIENDSTTIELNDDLVFLSPENATTQTFIDYQRGLVARVIQYEDRLYRMDTPFDSLETGELTGQTDTILGFECQHRVYNYFSNKVDVYFSEQTGKRGSPYSNFIPSENALVLKVVINGNRELIASKIDTVSRAVARSYPYETSKPITAAEFEELQIKSRYTTLSVFKEQQINFDPGLEKPVIRDVVNDKIYRLASGTVVLKKISLPEIVKEGCYSFINLTCRSNGDAYDRTGSVFAILPEDGQSMLDALQDSIQVVPFFEDRLGNRYHGYRLEQASGFTPALEFMRFFTSFGAGHFNDKRVINNFDWKEKATYEQEITDLIPTDQDEIWIGVFIGNYDKGGHIVNLDLEFFPSFEDGTNNRLIQPLFNTVNILEMAGQEYPRLFKTDTLKVKFEVPENLENLQLLFTSTGHGGWGGGDEFNPKLNELFLDGNPLFRVIPWRTDCAKYRLYNPASGNFSNGMSSSDFSRSNWCPATSTPPYIIHLNNLTPGAHTLEIAIDQGEDEGSSFNAWGVSGILTGTYKQ
jgi:hypothetical protein